MTSSNYLFQLSPLCMWVVNAKTLKFLAVNKEAIRCYGYAEAEWLSMTLTEIMSGDDDQQVDNSRSPEEKITRHTKKNGDIIFVQIAHNLISYEGAEAMLAVVTDVTVRQKNAEILLSTVQKYSEQEVKLNAERYNIISKATSDTIWDWDLSMDEIIWNKGIKGIFGYKDLIDNTTSGKWWHMQIHPEDRERVWNTIQHHIKDKIVRWKDEYRFACADGSYKYVLDRGFMVFDEQDSPVRMIGSMQDISQRKQEEQWSRLLESVVINATDAVLICTGNVEGSGQSIIYVNEAFTRMSGYSKYELIGASPRISQGPETEISEIKRLKEAIDNKVPCEIEVINYTKQGKEYWVSQSNAPIADAGGTVTHWISIQRDITQNKKHLKEMEEQNRKFKEIAWIQSHLVRAPLARVMALVDLLKNFTPGDDKDELLLHLSNSAKELDAIIINIADKTPSGEN